LSGDLITLNYQIPSSFFHYWSIRHYALL